MKPSFETPVSWVGSGNFVDTNIEGNRSIQNKFSLYYFKINIWKRPIRQEYMLYKVNYDWYKVKGYKDTRIQGYMIRKPSKKSWIYKKWGQV